MGESQRPHSSFVIAYLDNRIGELQMKRQAQQKEISYFTHSIGPVPQSTLALPSEWTSPSSLISQRIQQLQQWCRTCCKHYNYCAAPTTRGVTVVGINTGFRGSHRCFGNDACALDWHMWHILCYFISILYKSGLNILYRIRVGKYHQVFTD